MHRKLIINYTQHETRVALIEEGDIVELFIERHDENDIAGNIYKGRVQRVLPGMQAAFVDIGLDHAAFLYVDDVISPNITEMETMFAENGEESAPNNDMVDPTTPCESRQKPSQHIEDMIFEGQEIMVHVTKTPMGTKGARVTSYISLPGRFLVFMPNSDHIGISRRIESEAERTRLKEMVLSLRDDHYGYIVRTVGEGVEKEKFAYEMGFLKNLWENIQVKHRSSSAPCLLHKDLNVSLRAVRDLLTHEAEQLIIDDKQVYNSVLEFLETFMPNLKDSVELYSGEEPIFEAFNLEGDIQRALKRKVWLKSGGYIVIEQAEALTAIDVNTGRYVGKHNLEETILKTNLEAVKEIAYQIRLRDIGGIIIIDFIDMQKKANQEKVYNALLETLKKDRSKTHVLPFSEIGLIQMTRKRIRQSLNRLMCEPCFYCEGEGHLMSPWSICYMIYRDILKDYKDMSGTKITIQVNPQIAELLHGEENRLVLELEGIIGKQIIVYPNPQFHLEQFDIFETLAS
jgi:ribonuclease G